MELQYNEYLSKDDRKKYTERLITLHNVLAEDTSTEYRHELWVVQKRHGFFKRLFTGHSCGTAACALGHAMVHCDRFPGLTYYGMDGIGGIPSHETLKYFGPNTPEYIFFPDAYDVEPEKVTRQMAMDRIEQYITQVLGCKLIEA